MYVRTAEPWNYSASSYYAHHGALACLFYSFWDVSQHLTARNGPLSAVVGCLLICIAIRATVWVGSGLLVSYCRKRYIDHRSQDSIVPEKVERRRRILRPLLQSRTRMLALVVLIVGLFVCGAVLGLRRLHPVPSKQPGDALPSFADFRAKSEPHTALPGDVTRFIPSEIDVPKTEVSANSDLPDMRPKNGYIIGNYFANHGRGTLTISNGSGSDALVKVIRAQLEGKYVCFYVRAQDHFRLRGIPDGTFAMHYCLGSHFQGIRDNFNVPAGCWALDRNMTFVTERSPDQVRWTRFEATLHAVAGGNVHATPIEIAAF